MPDRKIAWTKKALRQFDSAIKYIRSDSNQNADKIKRTILDKIGQLSSGKIVHRQDPHKKNNDGSFLYFETMKYRIVYRVQGEELSIIRIRHTKMEPLDY